jgi:hypothetical protein
VAPHFLYLAWMQQIWRGAVQTADLPMERGRPPTLTPRQYGAALLMAYLGGFSLGELAAIAGLDYAILKEWRESPDFLLVMDWSKSRFSQNFQENLLLEDFPWQRYQEIAGEFACLEESLRVRVRTGLYPQLRTNGKAALQSIPPRPFLGYLFLPPVPPSLPVFLGAGGLLSHPGQASSQEQALTSGPGGGLAHPGAGGGRRTVWEALGTS